jgi:hypothetical protein
VAVLGGILGALVGFVLGVVVEVTFWNDRGGWADTIPFAVAAAGALIGSALGRRFRARRAARAQVG